MKKQILLCTLFCGSLQATMPSVVSLDRLDTECPTAELLRACQTDDASALNELYKLHNKRTLLRACALFNARKMAEAIMNSGGFTWDQSNPAVNPEIIALNAGHEDLANYFAKFNAKFDAVKEEKAQAREKHNAEILAQIKDLRLSSRRKTVSFRVAPASPRRPVRGPSSPCSRFPRRRGSH